MVTALQDAFARQRATVLANMGDGSRIGKSYTKKSWLNDLIVWGDEDELVSNALDPILYSLLVETGQSAFSGLALDPSMFNPITTNVLNYYQQRATKIAVDVNDETEKQLRAALSQGIADGKSTYELRAVVEDIMGNASTMRADRIARTETTRAQSYGDIEAWTQSGVVSGKEWYTARDENVCVYCSDLDGTVLDLDINFFNLGDVQTVTVEGKDGKPKEHSQTISYDDVPGPPAHVSCRCSLLPVRT